MLKNSKDQVFSLASVLRQIAINEGNPPIKAAPTPPAPSGKLCYSQGNFDAFSSLCVSLIGPSSPAPLLIRAIIELMMLNGLRVSEVLNIKGSDISASGIVLVKGLKGSNNRFCVSSVHREFWIARRSNPSPLSDIYSRFYLYREFKKLGISLITNHSSKKAVTHAFRHLLVTQALSIDKDFAAVKNLVGHKSQKSSHHYDNTKPKQKKKP